ncbi:MAG TPA: hypothetical protein VLH85_04990 [Levilinea sp.]|nr:hypothetical protein [Levilinea sp.]
MSYLCDFGEFDLSFLVNLHLRSGGDEATERSHVREARTAGMRAVLLRQDCGSTFERAAGMPIGSGRFLAAGTFRPGNIEDLNVRAIEAALAAGAKLVDLSACTGYIQPGGISLPALHAALDCLREGDVILASGELTEENTVGLVKAALEMGLRRVLVPAAHVHNLTQAGLHTEGVFFEWSLSGLRFPADRVEIAALAGGLRQAGIAASVIVSGQLTCDKISPVAALSYYLAALARLGMPVSDLKQMAGRTPGYLLGQPERAGRKWE